ncbi:hypothetical protein F5Y10DRAFT_252613 [Nemania abortiva]|nr:hypothetical protein F5Y10DRAFT_252613 [Nemania abortiva]
MGKLTYSLDKRGKHGWLGLREHFIYELTHSSRLPVSIRSQADIYYRFPDLVPTNLSRMATRMMRLTRPPSFLRPRPSSATTRASPPNTRRLASTFQAGASPPRLPPDEQAEFERLQRVANTQAGFTATSSPDFSSPPASAQQSQPSASASTSSTTPSSSTATTTAAAAAKGGHTEASLAGQAPTPLRKGAPPEFEGDVNPHTGEVGGPKNEPLRWGAGGDYSYNGRVTDF